MEVDQSKYLSRGVLNAFQTYPHAGLCWFRIPTKREWKQLAKDVQYTISSNCIV
jgi:hypothetical protein